MCKMEYILKLLSKCVKCEMHGKNCENNHGSTSFSKLKKNWQSDSSFRMSNLRIITEERELVSSCSNISNVNIIWRGVRPQR